MTKVERQNIVIKKRLKEARLIQNLEFLFMLNFAAIDLSLIISQLCKLNVFFEWSRSNQKYLKSYWPYSIFRWS